MKLYVFDDDFGRHEHNIKGPPYEPNIPIACTACLHRLKVRQTEWRAAFTKRRNLPPGFWN